MWEVPAAHALVAGDRADDAADVDVLEGSGGDGIILSVGGGVSPGMPRQNIVAMQEALAEFNGRRALAGAGT